MDRPLPRPLVTALQLLAVGLCCALPAALAEEPPRPAAAAADQPAAFFRQQVEPILEQHCFKCHGAGESIKGGLRLTSRAGILQGGDTGPAVSLDKPAESLLLEAINYESYEMPPSGKLPQEKIDVLTRWVRSGLAGAPERAEPAAAGAGHGPPPVNAETKKFWSFQPVRRPTPPQVADPAWVRNPIDAFILKRLEEAGLEPAAAAEKTALLRRAHYDLTGLPPTPEDVAAFLQDDSPGAFQRVVDRLLESPHYGERWARHWLDLVRYAETNSYERDGPKPFVWRYRDYVIRSLNEDKPYDQFVREQLAGDELDEVTRESIIATGYYRLGIWQDEPVDAEQELYEDLDDLVRTTGEVFLGLTVGCARCHDHKLDPIPQRDYYRMLAFFRNVRRYGVRSHETVLAASVREIASDEQRRRHEAQVQAHQQQVEQNKQQLAAMDKKLKADLQGVENDEWKNEGARLEIAEKRIGGLLTQEEFDRYAALTRRRDELRRSRPPGLEQALCVKEHGRNCPPTHVLVRGNAHVPGEQVEPGFPAVLSPPPPQIAPPPDGNSTGRRRALAHWIADERNPLTARVIVNRIWHHHFGRGLVRTTSDFGFQGAAPTHPQLLDWLASEFVAGDWRLKRLHKLIMLSAAYQMSSTANARALREDPTNDLFWRFDMRRLSAEEVRDSILAVNGSLNRGKMYGPGIYTVIPQEVLAGQSRPGSGWGTSSPEDRARRSIYIHVKRSLVVPMIASFDGPDTDASCPVRFVTTQPTQALGMLNSDFLQEQARLLAAYVRQRAGDDPREQLALALWRVLQREPTAVEVERGLELLRLMQQRHQASAEQALNYFCLAALNLNEFMYLD